MHLQALYGEKIFGHAKTQFLLPAHGVVTIQGANGSGKSGLLEMGSVAFWGRTLRDNPPWSSSKGGIVRAAARVGKSLVEVERTQSKALKIVVDSKETTYETTTKAQAALELLVGPWDVWRRCSVFSSSDAAHFSLATDADRKRLLERVVGIDQFDEAAESLRGGLRAAQLELSTAQNNAQHTAKALHTAKTALEEAQATASKPPAHAPKESSAVLTKRMERLEKVVKGADKARVAAQAAHAAVRRQEAIAGANRSNAHRALQLAKSRIGKECPECGQAWPGGNLDALKQAYEDADVAHEEVVCEEDSVREVFAEAVAEFEEANKQWRAVEIAMLQAHAVEREQAILGQAVTRAQEAFDKAGIEDTQAQATVKGCMLRAKELEAAVDVVGLRGARSVVLAEAIAQFSVLAQQQVSRFAPGVTLSISPFTSRKSGAVAESINIEVKGFGGGAYKGASQGERRRLDVALLLALGQLEAASSGYHAGTLFADEVFDALDTEGVETLREVLGELAQDRCVVVISHAQEVLRSVNATAAYEVVAGKVRQV